MNWFTWFILNGLSLYIVSFFMSIMGENSKLIVHHVGCDKNYSKSSKKEVWVSFILKFILCNPSDNHPQEDLAMSGYRPNMKYKILIIRFSIFLATY